MERTSGSAVLNTVRLMLVAALVALGVVAIASRAFGSFDAPVNFAVGNGPEFVAVGDLNGDGKSDLVTANTSASTVSILLGDGAGSFSPAPESPVAVGAQPRSVAIGNLDAGGVPDLAVASSTANNVSVLLGDGDGTFGTADPFSTGIGTLGARSVAIGNFDADGFADLAITNQASVNLSVLLGDGAGSFSPAPGSPYPVSSKPAFTPSSPFGIAIGNFNGGSPDLVIGSQSTSVYVLFGNGSGGFTSTTESTILMGDEPPTPGTEPVPHAVATGDLDGDGFDDIVSANRDDNSISVVLGNGDGTFEAKTQFDVGTNPTSVAIGNLNGGSIPDIAVSNADRLPSDDSISVLLGTGGGSFGAATSLTFPPPNQDAEPNSIAIANLNADSLPDLVTTAGNNVSVWPGTTAPTANVAPSRLDFEPRDLATTSAAQTLTFSNTSDADQVEVGAITIAGGQAADFAISSQTCSAGTLAPAATCEVNVTFAPSAAGQRFAQIQIEFNGASSPLSVDLAGVGNEPPVCPEFTTGTPPDCDPIPCPAGFTGNEPDCDPVPCPAGFTGNEPDCVQQKARISKVKVTGPAKVKRGRKATYKVAITNSGNAGATGVGLKASGKGISSKSSVGTIAAGQTKTVKIKIKPMKTGRIKATFKVTSSNAGGKSLKKTITVRK